MALLARVTKFFWPDDDEDQLNRIEWLLGQQLSILKRMERTLMATAQTLNDLQAAVTQQQTVEASAITLLQGLAEQLSAAIAGGADDAQLEQFAAAIKANVSGLAAAVTANTPAQTTTTNPTPTDTPPADTTPPATPPTT